MPASVPADLRSRVAILGDDLVNLAIAFAEKGDLEGAEAVIARALTIYTTQFGATHQRTRIVRALYDFIAASRGVGAG